MPDAPTSDGEPRPNVTPLLTVPTRATIDDNARISALIALCTAVNGKGHSIPVPDQSASYNTDTAMKYLAPACSAMGLSVPLSLDYSAFTPVFNAVATAVG